MLRHLRASNLEARGIVGFYPANSKGDDIILYKDDTRSEQLATLHTLRQQAENDVIEH